MCLRLARLLCCFLAGLFLSACENSNPLLNGIGSSVYSDSVLSRAKLQDQYFGLMCVRSNISFSGDTEDTARCPDYNFGEDSNNGMQANHWQMVVYAALNDIDERCSAYLDSLDAAERMRAAYVRQLSSTNTTANVIIGLTGGVGPQALAIVQAAFGLAENSLDNYYSRLILQVEKSTVHSLVLKRQTAFRQILYKRNSNNQKLIDSVRTKPGAYFAIRGYLRLCLPSTIEGQITTVIDEIRYTDNESVSSPTAALTQYLADDSTGAYISGVAGRKSSAIRDSANRDPDLEMLRSMPR